MLLVNKDMVVSALRIQRDTTVSYDCRQISTDPHRFIHRIRTLPPEFENGRRLEKFPLENSGNGVRNEQEMGILSIEQRN